MFFEKSLHSRALHWSLSYILSYIFVECTMSEEGQTGNRINLDQPFWDQSTYLGRLRHFFWLTDPRTVTSTNKQLNDAKELVEKYR